MSYHIDYTRAGMPVNRKVMYIRLPILIVLSFSIFLFLVHRSWPEGASWIHNAARKARDSILVESLEQFSEDFRQGDSVIDAVSSFCQNIFL